MTRAMRCGLPIVTTAFPSDCLPVIGVENAVDGGYPECKKYVERLFSDKELRRRIGELMRQRFIANAKGMEEYVRKLLEIGYRINK